MEASTARWMESRIESPSLAELAAERISELVFRGELVPHDRLVEEQLCQRLGVSRAPIREGLRILEGSGLLVRRPRAGVSVAGLSQDDVFEILSFREGLERMAVEHLYRYTEDLGAIDSAPLDAALDRLTHEFRHGDDEFERIQASHGFHTEVVRLCRNSRIVTSYAQITMQVKLCMSMNLRKLRTIEPAEDNIRRHRQLRDSVLSGDLKRALHAIDTHGHDAFVQDILGDLPKDTDRLARWIDSHRAAAGQTG